jgi:CheY-specific phosphatase CheX
MSSTDAKSLHRRMLPSTFAVATDRLEDLVGELCNQILGRINAFFSRYSCDVQQTTPLFIRSAGSSLRYAGQHPSFGIQLASGQTSISLEYYLADFDKSKLLVGTSDQVMNAGEVHFL